jgi:hypothetical protein
MTWSESAKYYEKTVKKKEVRKTTTLEFLLNDHIPN